MIGEKWLSNVIFTTVQSKADISQVRKGVNGDFQSGDLSRAINTEETNEITVRAWLARAQGRMSTIGFCVDLTHIAGLTDMFRRHGIDARFVTGDTPKQVRSERLDEFKNGIFPVLLNCGVFTEGTDIPNIDCVLLARPTRSRNLLVQMIGRGMRLHPGKRDCHVIDMVASLETGIVTTPTLFGLDPAELVKEVDVHQLRELHEHRRSEVQSEALLASEAAGERSRSRQLSRNITFTDYDSVYDLIDDTSGERHIRDISQFAWVQVGQDRYILSTQSGDYLTIEKDASADNHYLAKLTSTIPESTSFRTKSPYMRPRNLTAGQTFLDAIHAADTYASEKFPRHFISKDTAWRRSPATEGQLNFLNKLRDMDAQLTADNIKKGKAADMITKIKFGAKSRYGKIEAARRKETRVGEKLYQLANLRKREEVRVGPLG